MPSTRTSRSRCSRRSRVVDVRASLDEVFADLSRAERAVVVGIAGRPAAVLTRSDLLEFLSHRRTHVDLTLDEPLLRADGRRRPCFRGRPSPALAFAPRSRTVMKTAPITISAPDDGQRVELLVEDAGSEHDRDERVHVLVRDHLRDRGVAEEPGVRRERDQRARDGEVHPRRERGPAETPSVSSLPSPSSSAATTSRSAAAEHLVDRRDERVARQRSRWRRTTRSTSDTTRQHERQPDRLRAAARRRSGSRSAPAPPGRRWR